MIRMGKQTERSPSDVIDRAVAFFGPSGWGLEIMDRDDCRARFYGAGGYVSVLTANVESKRGWLVTVEGREWESQIQQFVINI